MFSSSLYIQTVMIYMLIVCLARCYRNIIGTVLIWNTRNHPLISVFIVYYSSKIFRHINKYLSHSTLGKVFSRWHIEIFFLFFPENRFGNFMQINSNLQWRSFEWKCQNLFWGKKWEKSILHSWWYAIANPHTFTTKQWKNAALAHPYHTGKSCSKIG